MVNYFEWRKLLGGKRSFFAWVVAVIAALIYLPSVAPDAVPGLSAALISEHSGTDLFAPISNVLWGWTASIVEHLPVGTTTFRWNLLSALCGVLNGVLVYLLTTSLIGNRLDQEIVTGDSIIPLQNYGGLTAALLYVCTEPVRHVSAMAHPINFDLLILLSSLWLLIRFLDKKSLIFGAGSLFLFGLSMTQYPTTVLFSPFYAGFFIYGIWKGRLYSPIRLTTFAAAFLLSCVPFLFSILRFMDDPSYRWAGMAGYGGVIWNAMREYYIQLRYSVPAAGITVVLLVAVAPFIFTVLVPKRNRPGYRSLMLVGFIICIIMFYHLRPAPWQIFGMSPLLIMPYVVAAAWSGCLAAYALGMIRLSLFILVRRSRSPSLGLIMEWCCIAMNAALIISAATVSHLNFSSTAYPRGIIRAAEQVAGQLKSGSWIMTDRRMEPLIRIKAKEQGKSFIFITPSRFNHQPYQNALCAIIADDRLCNMIRAGFVPFMREAFHPSRAVQPDFAVMGNPAIMNFIQKPVRPDTTVYTTQWEETESLDDYLSRQLETWDRIGEKLRLQSERNSKHQELQRFLLQNLSRTANDSGVWLDEKGRDDLAVEAYRAAVKLWPVNLSAHLNLQQHTQPDDPEFVLLGEEIEQLSLSLRGRTDLQTIIATYGAIRSAESIADEAARWSQAGYNDLAQSLMQDVISEKTDNDSYNMFMASMLASSGDTDQSEKLLADAIRLNTNNISAIVGIARIAAANGKNEMALKFIQALRERGGDPSMLDIEEASILLGMDKKDEAQALLVALDRTGMKDPRIWAMLALLTAEAQPRQADLYIEKLENFPDLIPQFYLPLARLQFARGNAEAASRHLQKLLRSRPMDQNALHLLLKINLKTGKLDQSMTIIRQLLTLNAHDPLAQYALGAHHFSKGDYDAARIAWEISLAGDPLPETQNDYAYLLHLQGENENALTFARASLAAQPTATAWDTTASILIALGRQPEAAEAVANGLQLDPEHAGLLEKKTGLNGP